MARISSIAATAGLNPVTCAHCGKRTRTDRAVALFFRRIVERLAGGERVQVKDFGTFTAGRAGIMFNAAPAARELTGGSDGTHDQR
jgi:hypothetical protein